MNEETTEVSLAGLARLRSAAIDFAHLEIARITKAVIVDLQSRPAIGIFDEVAARHMWDEYCWSLQEGPFDNSEYVGELSLGSLSGNWDETVRASVQGEVEKVPRHAQTLLSVRALEGNIDGDENTLVGSIWFDGIVDLVIEAVSECASERKLDLIGPYRSDMIGYEAEGSGLVWSVLSDRGEAMDLLAEGTDAMIDPNGDLSVLANKLSDAFMTAASEDDEGVIFSALLKHFGVELGSLVREHDVVPLLDNMRDELLDRLDGQVG